MKLTPMIFRMVTLGFLLAGARAQAANLTGTVTDKTTGKPSAGDTVVLVDPQAGMKETARATSDERGHYSLNRTGNGPALVRVTHQGADYFIAAPQGNAPGDIAVYDVAARVDGVSTEQEIVDVEAENGQLDITEHYLVHNTSSPRRTQFSSNTFEFVLPPEAVLDGAEATRPNGLPTTAMPRPLAEKGHFTFNVPIQPDEGGNQTLFELRYHLTYSGKYSFDPKVLMPVQFFAVRLPKSIVFSAAAGVVYVPVPQNPAIQTFLIKDAVPGKPLGFTVSGSGSLPRDDQGGQNSQQGGGQESGGQEANAPGTGPGGGIGTPINTPDPLSKYKGWILGGVALLLVVAAAFLLRKPAPGLTANTGVAQAVAAPAERNAALLNALKEELFALESEKIAGTLTAAEYAELKAALEVVLKRALKRSS
ncbi:MAG: carboxypeptidase regulatory-like domain-containing protein [Terracidiphilus sp.]